MLDRKVIQNCALKKKRHWLQQLMEFARPGTILECGCGSGFVCDILSSHFPHSYLIGIDKSFHRLLTLKQKTIPHTFPVQANIRHLPLTMGSCDTVFFVSSLHEVFSLYGTPGVYDVLGTVHSLLKNEGRLIIQDFLRPPPRQVTVEFKEPSARTRFIRFATEFRVRPILYEESSGGVKVDIGDALEFFSKYDSPCEEDWQEEMNESHYFNTQEAYEQMATDCSYTVTHLSLVPAAEELFTSLSRDMHWDFSLAHQYIQLVLIPR
ncbi:MAG: methyltransferase domain-containing protein [Candidatus Thorarchaeota archaeon]|jgi:SAM-dependent methyltransferase